MGDKQNIKSIFTSNNWQVKSQFPKKFDKSTPANTNEK